jgi:hypothetical protein
LETWETPNDFSKMKNRDILFDICLVIDEVLREKYPPSKYISDGVYKISKSKGWVKPADTNEGSLNQNLNPMVSGENALPDAVVPALLDRKSTYRGNSIGAEMS